MRLIDADRLKDSIKKLEAESPDIKTARIIDRTIQEIFPQIIDDEPTIDAEPVKRGRWEVGGVCSECGFMHDDFAVKWFSYCPNCGARMDGGDENA